MQNTYRPDEIAHTLDKLTFNIGDLSELTDALYWIESAAQNDMNPDHWRTLWQTLSELVYNHDSGRIKTEV